MLVRPGDFSDSRVVDCQLLLSEVEGLSIAC
jgi:hypothetical protein